MLTFIPTVLDLVAALPITLPGSENSYLPSDIPLQQQSRYGIGDLAKEELLLRQGEAYDAVQPVRQAVKFLM